MFQYILVHEVRKLKRKYYVIVIPTKSMLLCGLRFNIRRQAGISRQTEIRTAEDQHCIENYATATKYGIHLSEHTCITARRVGAFEKSRK